MTDDLFPMPHQPAPELARARSKLGGLHKLIAEIEDREGAILPDNDPLVRQAADAAEAVKRLEQAELDRCKR